MSRQKVLSGHECAVARLRLASSIVAEIAAPI